MNYSYSDMSNSTNTVVRFDGKCGHLYLYFWSRSHTIYAAQVDCLIFQPFQFKYTIIQQHVLLKWEGLIDGTAITIILCLHVLIAHRIFINFFTC